MFPMEFDHKILSSLPVPSEQGTKKVFDVLNTVVAQRVVPYFRNHRGTDLIHLSLVKQNLDIQRLEDGSGKVRLVCLSTKTEDGWTVKIHERIFDYLAFVIPLKPELALGDGSIEERKMIAYAEFVLRHELEHMLYPERKELELIRSDVSFAMEWCKDDPTAYRMLRAALEDEMNGICGKDYLKLFDRAEAGISYERVIGRILDSFVGALSDLPTALLEELFMGLDKGIKTRVLGECYRTSRSTSYSLVKRASSFQKILQLFAMLIRKNKEEAKKVFRAFKDRWGLVTLFHELDLPEPAVEESDLEELFDLFKIGLEELMDEVVKPTSPHPSISVPATPKSADPSSSSRNLNTRIEDARNDPHIPKPVIELIEKNKLSAGGQSGAKYAEFIETLLAIPWKRIRKIRISPDEFEEGLNRTHYGLQKPKEVICDFFANLIWRYVHFKEDTTRPWRSTGSAFLFVGPPGVGKTSLAISIAQALGIPYHKISLAGMRDEADIRGYGFTYEGSKPGPIVQGLIKMGVINGMFILDEVDKTEKFAIATLLEILDPEQNHLFHDKYTQSTVDIDLSNCHFILTANTLETVPPPVLDRCEVIFLDRYSVEEKIAIARLYLIQRIRQKYMIDPKEIFFDPDGESDLLRHLIRTYTVEAGVRDLERVIRNLFLRIQRKEILARGKQSVRITMDKIKAYLEEPIHPRLINNEDRVGEMMGLGVNMELGMGSLIPIQVARVNLGGQRGKGFRGYTSIVHATGNIEKIMDESRKVATTAIIHCADSLGIDPASMEHPVHLHFMGASTKKDGPSAGGAITLALASFFLNRKVRRDVVMTGEIDTQGRIMGIGGLGVKLETAYAAGCKTMVIPKENLQGTDGISRLPDALKQELQILTYDEWNKPHQPFDYTRHVLQVVAVDHIVQAADIAFVNEEELNILEQECADHARRTLEDVGASRRLDASCLKVVYIDGPEEVDCQSGLIAPDFSHILLTNAEVKEAIESNRIQVGDNVDLWEFNPAHDDFSSVVQKIRNSFTGTDATKLRISVIGPLEFMRRHVAHKHRHGSEADPAHTRLFVSSCTVENVKVRNCRKVLHQVYHHLGNVSRSILDECPFLRSHDGMYSVSLAFIPEKYRLDVQRAEEILHRCLARWLSVVEEQRQGDWMVPCPDVDEATAEAVEAEQGVAAHEIKMPL